MIGSIKRHIDESENIGKLTIFLLDDEGKCFLVSDAGMKENFIYFAQDRNLYVFDLDDQSITVFLPCPKVSKNNTDISGFGDGNSIIMDLYLYY